GVGSHKMEMSSAISTYTMLTVGDGLVSQIPALLISISAGFIVTRINGDGTNLGKSIVSQMFGMPMAVAIAAALALLVAILPGFPAWVFMLLSAALGTFLYMTRRSKKEAQGGTEHPSSELSLTDMAEGGGQLDGLGIIDDLDRVATETVALIL